MPEFTPAQIFRVRELTLRYRPQRLDSPFPGQIADTASAAKLASQLLKDAATEEVIFLHLNAKQGIVGIHRLVGSTTSVAVSVDDVVRAALLSNACSLLMVHNHLSGDPQPSPEDRALVERMKAALAMMNLEFLDAIIVVDPSEGEQYFSFRSEEHPHFKFKGDASL